MAFRKLVDALNGNSSIRSLKNVRNAAIDGYFRKHNRIEGERLADRLKAENARHVCFAVAFNAPWALDLLTASFAKYVDTFRLVVIDNSKSPESRALNRRICEARSVPYLGLPPNPEWSPNRSHGISMNWIYHNIVRRLEPVEFGFIDHDCFPVRPFDLSAHLAGKAVYGLRKARLAASWDVPWNLWAGFCFYRFAETLAQPLDFKHAVELKLDTGGSNWTRLYSRLSEAQVGSATLENFDLPLEDDVFRCSLIADTFIHLGGASYRGHFKGEELRRHISDTIWKTYLGGQSPVLSAP